jgi:hypothetical protein
MVSISELLINGDERIMHYCRNAKEKWSVILEKHPDFDLDNLSEEISSSQPWFEKHCGGEKLGQEIMVTVGIGQFYSSKEGFDGDNLKNAQAIYEAIKRSNCSAEVKLGTEKVAQDYNLYGK